MDLQFFAKKGKYFPYDESKLDGVRIVNKKRAGTTFIPKGEVGKKYSNGVKYDDLGFPDFSAYSLMTITVDGLTGGDGDMRKADKVAGINASFRYKRYTWHHVEDGKTMMLVPMDLHKAVRHTGGASLLDKGILP